MNRRIGEPENWKTLKNSFFVSLFPPFPVSPFLPFFFFLALLCGCSRTIRPSLERLDPGNIPAFFDDRDRPSLKTAVTQSLTALRQTNDTEALAFGEERIPVARVRESLTAFLALLEAGTDLRSALTQDFDVYRVTSPVLFTGYYEPVLNGSLVRTTRYHYPLYRRPDDLVEVDLAEFSPERPGEKLYGRVVNGKLIPYFSRAEIDGQGVLEGKRYELVWVDDPVERFFLHIQGSGQIQLPDGARLRVGYAAANGKSYQSIGKVLLDQGKLHPGETSTPAIRHYLQAHPAEQDAVFFRNPRYIFFQPTPDGPRGSLGVPLTAGRSLATDPTIYPPGALGFIHA
ncbi:MAG: MltA domain-containing protein, partial [Deltaproteobacteria bacterium]|nr:MltA domain-containing protein [Deltaproteobacteria bacterium]